MKEIRVRDYVIIKEDFLKKNNLSFPGPPLKMVTQIIPKIENEQIVKYYFWYYLEGIEYPFELQDLEFPSGFRKKPDGFKFAIGEKVKTKYYTDDKIYLIKDIAIRIAYINEYLLSNPENNLFSRWYEEEELVKINQEEFKFEIGERVTTEYNNKKIYLVKDRKIYNTGYNNINKYLLNSDKNVASIWYDEKELTKLEHESFSENLNTETNKSEFIVGDVALYWQKNNLVKIIEKSPSDSLFPNRYLVQGIIIKNTFYVYSSDLQEMTKEEIVHFLLKDYQS